MNTHLSHEELNRLAHKRASAKLGWFIHAAVYATVNLLLLALAFMHGRHWVVFPALGWGLGLLIHGAVVFIALPGSGLHQHLLQRERQYLDAQRDPW